MSRRPLVVGLLLNYRDAIRSEACVRSLLADGIDRVLVWDNSEDGYVSAAMLMQRLSEDQRVLLHLSEANVGFAVGVNLAVELCLQQWPDAWILLINNDAYLHQGALNRLCAVLEQYPEAVLAVPRIRQRSEVTGPVYYHRLSGILSRRPWPGCTVHPSGCCFLFAPQRLELPLFDESFFMYGEDCALGLRLVAGSEVIYLADVLVSHDGSASSGLGSRFYEERMVAAHLLLVERLASTPLKAFFLTCVRLVVLCARALVRSWRFASLTPLKALWWGARLAWWRDPLRAVAKKQAADYRKPAACKH